MRHGSFGPFGAVGGCRSSSVSCDYDAERCFVRNDS